MVVLADLDLRPHADVASAWEVTMAAMETPRTEQKYVLGHAVPNRRTGAHEMADGRDVTTQHQPPRHR